MPRGKKVPEIPAKLCTKCGGQQPIKQFHRNRGWKAQIGTDVWCKECTSKIKDLEGLKEYCWYNNRGWKDETWDQARKQAVYNQASNEKYLDPNGDIEQKHKLEFTSARNAFFGQMNLTSFYSYTANIEEGTMFRAYEEQMVNHVQKNEADGEGTLFGENQDSPSVSIYSPIWNGYYTQEELEYMESYYAKLEEDFVLNNASICDYARKMVKASLHADQKYNKARNSPSALSEWKEAHAIFDSLSKSGNFAECRRKASDAPGMGSLGEIIAQIEITGALEAEPVVFPPDEVDVILNDFRHILTAVGLDGAA